MYSITAGFDALDVAVTTVGEQVKAGQKLLVTEAMKLETVIKAPVTGVVREIVSDRKSVV